MSNEARISAGKLAGMIEHTLLKPEATPEEIKRVCKEAIEFDFANVCVNPSYVKLAKEKLRGSNVKVCTVIGFPLGATTTKSKVCESEDAISNGAQEIDMVTNIGRLKAKDYIYVENEIRKVVTAVHSRGMIVKVIIEACLLTDEEKSKACLLAKAAGADFVKTSTGFNIGGATASDVALMRRVVGNKMGVKASGGVKSYSEAILMLESGATRIGTSSGIKIILESGAITKMS
ncbi:MAG: deoxyribose-phosphate aldolase [Candidatus Kryptoniota bacterium]